MADQSGKRPSGLVMWFAQKRYGYGAGLPIVWQGWAALIVFVIAMAMPAMVAARLHFADLRQAWVVIAIVAANVVCTGIFLWICKSRTLGGWSWRWGEQGRDDR